LLLAFQDGLEGVAGLGDVGEVEAGRGLLRRRADGAAAAAVDVAAHLLGFILFDGAGVGLFLSDADRFQSVKDGVALDFELSC
jgi:hypothetical protein